MRFYGLSCVANQKARKAIDNVRVILNKIHVSLPLRQVYGVFSPIYSRHLTILVSCYCKKQIDVSYLCVCPLIDDKFCLNIVY